MHSNSPTPSTYQRLSVEDQHDDQSSLSPTEPNRAAAQRTFHNFVVMSVLFSANHGCVAACMALATARLGSTGAWQSGILFLSYTLSSVLGATWIVKKLGSRDAILCGMSLYCAYVGCFWLATRVDDLEKKRVVAYIGAAVGGIGAGFLWTSQGAYFSKAAEDHAGHLLQSVSVSTSYLAGVFAFFYLSEELILRVLSTILVGYFHWEFIFALYTVIAVSSAMAMPMVYRYPIDAGDESDPARSTVFYKVTAAGQLLWKDPKMKYMIGLNAVFGFASAFLNSYVNGEVVPMALNDPDSKFVGILSAWASATAALMSMVFGRIAHSSGASGKILIMGAICFFCVVFPFLIQPVASRYGWTLLIMVYTFHGMGRATFESTLKATFADYFSYEKEGAFANIILQNGLAGAIGYVRKCPGERMVCPNHTS